MADAGRDLWLISQQDSNAYDSKQNSLAAGGSFTFGSMTGSGYINASQDKMKSTYDSVQEQTGLYAGKGGYDITVGNHTQLDGAVIASTAAADKNSLDTGTLGFSDIVNKADYKVSHAGASISGGGDIGGKEFTGNMAGGMASALSHSGHAEGTTQAAVSNGTITIRDTARQQQDVADLSRDTEHANDSISPIFDKEKEQKRLQAVQLVQDIGSQASDIARTQGQLAGLAAQKDPDALDNARAQLLAEHKTVTDEMVSQRAYDNAMQQYGTGSDIQRAIQGVTAGLSGLAGGNIAGALAGASAPELANLIGHGMGIDENDHATKALAHAILGGVVASLQGNSATAGAMGGASGELVAAAIANALYPGQKPAELSEEQKQTVSALASVSAGIAGGLTGDSVSGAAAGAQAGKNAVENNFLGATSSDKLDKAVEKIMNGDKSLATANELIKLENADKRSDALVSKFTKDPSQMTSTERAELAGYLRVYAFEMENAYGPAVAQQLVTGLLSGQDYMKRAPDSEAMSKAQSIMNTWGYHKSNASIGDAPLMFGGNVLGLTVKGMAANAAIGVGVNTVSQLSGKEPFSYVDAIMAGLTSAATTGKSIGASAAINMAGAAIGSGIKGENPTNSVIGAGLGSVAGSKAEKYITGGLSTAVKEGTAEAVGAVGGSTASEMVSDAAKNALDKAEYKDEKK